MQNKRLLVASARRKMKINMRWILWHSVRLVWVVAISALIVVNAQDNNQAVTLSAISAHQKVIAVVPWSVAESELLCVFTETRINSQGQTGPVRLMTVYRRQKSLLTKIFAEGSGDSFMNAFPLGEFSDRLLVGWVSGSAHHFAAYAYANGAVKKVLESGSKGMPEIIYDQNMRESIMVTNLDFRGGEWSPVSTDIYRWNGKLYDKTEGVPWAKRFEVLSGK